MSLHKKIILFNPPSPWLISDRVELPLGLLYLASYIRKLGHDVEIIDLSGNVMSYGIPEADYYGITFVSPQFVYAVQLLNEIKECFPKSKVLAGGVHATSMPEQVLNAGFDCVVRGEGEYAINQILTKGITKRIYDISYIQDLNTLPFPAWDLVDMESYVSNIGVVDYMKRGNREINVMATRGCTGRCSYCTTFKGPLRWRNIDNVINEIKYLKEKYAIDRIFFVDDNIVIHKSWLNEFCKEILKSNISWHCLGRADQVNYKCCQNMVNSGCMGIDFGIESGSQKVLNIINKHTTIQRQEAGIRSAYEAGLSVRAQFMVGLPGETEDDHKLNIEFIERNNQYVAKWGIHIFIPFPSCDIWQNNKNYKYEIDKNTNFWNYQTIGKAGEWNFKSCQNNETYSRRRDEILDIIGKKNIFRKAG